MNCRKKHQSERRLLNVCVNAVAVNAEFLWDDRLITYQSSVFPETP